MKKVLLTGGSRGIGKAIKEVLELQGYVVYAPTHEGLDLASKMSIEQFIKSHRDDTYDVIINNAGINPLDNIQDIKDNEFDECLMVNLIAPKMLIQGFVHGMIEQRYGRILNIASIWSVVSKPKRTSYSIAKTGLVGMTRTLAAELGQYGITVNAISPGFVNTELTKQNISSEEQKCLENQISLRRFASPKEIARIVAFLISEENSFMTGQNIVVDGGYTIQ